MVITCGSCETRFQVADGRIPEKGAWVRCSRCHHRFLVTPSSDGDLEGADYEDSAPPDAEEPGGSTETDLDNPQFLFDRAGADEDEDPDDRDDETAMQIEGSSTPMPGEDYGQTGWEPPADAGDMRAAPVPDALASAEDGPDPLAQEFEALEATGSAGEAEDSFAGIGIDVSELPGLDDDGDAMESWDTLATGRVPDAPAEGVPGAPPESKGRGSRRSRRDFTPASPEVGVQGPDLESFTLRVLAVIVAVALSAGGVRAVVLHGLGEVGGPETVVANGWRATDLQVFRLRDGSGLPVLVMRGKLYRGGREAPPRVQATLLDQSGRALAEPTPAVLVRLSDDELSPESLSERLAAYNSWTRAGAPAIVRGFTVLVHEPSADARRFRLEVLPARSDGERI